LCQHRPPGENHRQAPWQLPTIMLEKLKLTFPAQASPRITTAEAARATAV
jgi:hypothetical protein